MDNGGDILQLCRLCLVKDDVNIPIFDGQGDIRQIFLKISSCLPVKVSREDQLPKKICDGCSYKLDMLYEFWNTTANAEKQLLSWLGEAGMNSKMNDDTISAVAQQIKPVETFVKQETIDPSDIHTEENDDDKTYMFQQKYSVEEAGPSATTTATANEEEPPPKRARRTAAVKAQIAMDPESDYDDDSGEPITKVEDESEESEGEDQEPAFVDVPSTSADDQPGPSGVGKDGVEAPNIIDNTNDITNFYRCDHCGKVYLTFAKLKNHFRSHGNQNKRQQAKDMAVYKCELCEKAFGETSALNRHTQETHFKIPRFTCSKCGKSFYYKYLLIRHSKVEHEGIQPMCEICKLTFTRFTTLKKHQEEKHNPNYRKMKCAICFKLFGGSSSYRKHIKRHREEPQPIICEICGKTLSTPSSLKDHMMRRHNDEKPFQCEICDKAFTTSQSLKVHKVIHQEIIIECSICKKRFTQHASLRIHTKRVHIGIKPYPCIICKKLFATRTELKKHGKRCRGPKV